MDRIIGDSILTDLEGPKMSAQMQRSLRYSSQVASNRGLLFGLLLGLLLGAVGLGRPALRQQRRVPVVAVPAPVQPKLSDLVSATGSRLAERQQRKRQVPVVAAPAPVQAIPKLSDLVSATGSRLAEGQQRNGGQAFAETPPQRLEARRPVRGGDKSNSIIVWVCLGKPLIRDQLSLELGTRVGKVVRLLAAAHEQPNAICFCGGEIDSGPMTAAASAQPLVSSAPLAYSFFRTAVEAQALGSCLTDVRFIVEPRSPKVRDGVLAAAMQIRQTLRERNEVSARAASAAASAASAAGSDCGAAAAAAAAVNSKAPPPSVHVTLVATDHTLQRLVDIENLTPRDSPLRPLRDLGAQITFEHVADPYSYSRSVDAKRQARHVRLSEQLCVTLANLRGVEASTDLLHAENANLLSGVRRQLNEELWELLPTGMQRPRELHSPLTRGSRGYGDGVNQPTGAQQTCEVACVEAAVSCLGKAQDALEPMLNDPIGGRRKVSDAALCQAQECLAAAISALRLTDPDRPISTDEWLSLVNGGVLTDCPVARTEAAAAASAVGRRRRDLAEATARAERVAERAAAMKKADEKAAAEKAEQDKAAAAWLVKVQTPSKRRAKVPMPVRTAQPQPEPEKSQAAEEQVPKEHATEDGRKEPAALAQEHDEEHADNKHATGARATAEHVAELVEEHAADSEDVSAVSVSEQL